MAAPTKKAKSQVTREQPTRLLYLYAIARPVARKPLDLPGIDGQARVRPVVCGGFDCWVSEVDEREFGEDLARHMEDLEWLANASVRHQRVVARLAQTTDVLPARFGTVFRGEKSLAADVRGRLPKLKTQMSHIKEADEWGIKVFRRHEPASALVTESGSAYLQQKARLLKRDSSRQLEAAVVAFARELRAVARDSAPAGKVSSGQVGLEWQASFLVPRAKRKQWHRLLQRYATEWHGQREIEATGPWPPYSFVN